MCRFFSRCAAYVPLFGSHSGGLQGAEGSDKALKHIALVSIKGKQGFIMAVTHNR
jgi:hypothetical protein